MLATPADTANTIATWALIVAIGAGAVSIIAAGFTGWQAWTAHLERTRPRPAAWSFEYPTESDVYLSPWKIHNTGGSAASDVSVEIKMAVDVPEKAQRPVFRATAVIHPGTSAVLVGSEGRVDPRVDWVFNPKLDGTAQYTRADASNAPEAPPLKLIEGRAIVRWRDWSGRERAQHVALW